MVQKDTQFVMKNNQVQQPFIPTDGLELYYDVKGKKNTDNYKGTLLDMSGNGRHGTLSNFAYEGVSGFTGTTEGGLLLDDVYDKIVRPAISGIEYTSASRNLLNVNLIAGYYQDSQTAPLTTPEHRSFSEDVLLGAGTYYFSQKDSDLNIVRIRINGVATQTIPNPLVLTEPTYINYSFRKIDYVAWNLGETSALSFLQLEKGANKTVYTPYIPLPIMTYQMNGNVISYEKDGTVKRTTKDVNGNEVVVSRKGINLVRNGNFANGKTYWGGSYASIASDSELSISNSSTSRVYIQTNINTGINDKIYYSFLGKTDSIDGTLYAFGKTSALGSNTTLGYPSIEDSVDFVKCEGIVPTNGNVMYLGFISVVPSKSSIKNIQLINLTQAYGAGNEPTLAYIQAHPEEFAWTPNPNDLIETVEIKNNLVGDLENLQGNDFEQHEDGVVTYTNEAEAGSVVRVDIDGISDQPLRFRTAEGQQVVITEHDQIDADAIKKVEFAGESVQLADKYREVSGTSVTIDPTLHEKTVADKLVIGGNTTQYTESSNVVTDGLQMWLSGRNFSNNPATTTWKDLTGVNNGTASGFEYRTNVYAYVVSDFTGKVAGSVVENANIFKYNNNASTLIEPSNVAYLEDSTSQTSRIYTLDGIGVSCGNNVSGVIGKQMFSFNVIKAFEKIHGKIPSTDQTVAGKVAWLKDNLASIALSWTGYGNSTNGYKAYVRHWRVDSPTTGTWNDAFSATSTDSSPTTKTLLLNPSSVNMIDSNGFTHMLAYTDASDGVATSTIYTDYVSLTLKTSGASGSDGSGGVNFDGVDDYVTIPYKTTEATMSQALTLETKFSIKTIPVGKESNIIDKNGYSNYRFGISLDGFIHTTAQIKKSDGVPYYIDDYGPKKFYPIIGTTYHATYTISIPNKVIKLYINGSLFGQISLNSISSEIFLTQGVDTLVGKMIGSNYFNGDIYMTRIYNRALSDAEILQNYNAGLAIPIPNIAMPQEVKHVTSGSKVLVHGKNLVDFYNIFDTPASYYKFPYNAWEVKLRPNTSYKANCVLDKNGDTTSRDTYAIIATLEGVEFYHLYHWGQGSSYTNKTITTGASGIIYLKWYRGALPSEISITDIVKDFQLEEGTITTSYEPYTQTETTIPVTLKSIG